MGPNDTRPLGDADQDERPNDAALTEQEQRFADEWDLLTVSQRAFWGGYDLNGFVRWLSGFEARAERLTMTQRGTALLAASRYINAVGRDAYITAQIANLDDGADAAFERAGDR